MNVARKGKRVVFQPSAIARDRLFSEKGKEFSRKVRTLTGNYQLLRLAPWLLSPANPLLFRFISHKLLRLLVPLLPGSHAGGFRDGQRAILPRGLLASDSVLYIGHLRDPEPVRQEVQAGRNRQHICHAQRGRRACVLQFCGRAKESLGLVTWFCQPAGDCLFLRWQTSRRSHLGNRHWTLHSVGRLFGLLDHVPRLVRREASARSLLYDSISSVPDVAGPLPRLSAGRQHVDHPRHCGHRRGSHPRENPS